MSISPGYVQFKMANQLAPIILTGGIATAQGSGVGVLAKLDRQCSLYD